MLIGPNGHGKTNLLEALLYLEVFRSFRGAREREIARFGSDGFHVEARVAEGDGRTDAPTYRRTVEAGYDARTKVKRVAVDGLVPERLAEAIGVVRGVVLSPSDVVLVAGPPKERRRYLNVLLSLTAPGYVEALAAYRRVLRHRARATATDVIAFEAILARAGATLTEARAAWVSRWSDRYREHCAELGERGESSLSYAASGSADATEFRASLYRWRARDLSMGRTAVGPHRDDLKLSLNGHELRAYGSAGQQRTAAVAMRLVEAEALAEATGSAPIMCLDDAFAELDGDRSSRFGELVGRFAERGSQVFATMPRDGEMPEVVRGLARWRVENGDVRSD